MSQPLSGPAPYRAPSRGLLWTEALRASTEAIAYAATLPLLAKGPAGDGHRVLVLPGLLADDTSTIALRHLLRVRGYRPYAWRLGRNIGPTRRIRDGLFTRLDRLTSDGEPVTLIGWSLGGMLARELARQRPEQVRAVITLGSPFRLTVEDDPSATHAGRVFRAFRPWHTDLLDYAAGGEEGRPELQMPATSIYSKADGIVPWQACVDLPGERRESIETIASHLGMGAHPHVLAIILDRLAQPVDNWQKYAPSTMRAVAA